MSTTFNTYANGQMASAGFAILSTAWAWKLRPDLWATHQSCAADFRRITVDGAHRMRATLDGHDSVIVLARSLDDLARRIGWVTGCAVTSLVPEPEQAPTDGQAAAVAQQAKDKQAAAALAKTRELAALELPAHDCDLRRSILKARVELGQLAGEDKHATLAP